jgi:bifunctional non-homologous end joining protein LigD
MAVNNLGKSSKHKMAKSGKSSRESSAHIEPMLCTLIKEPPSDSNYLFELKWDGYRIIAYVENGKVRMDSRGGLDYTSKYPAIAEALSAIGHNVILDGEVVVFNGAGKPDFDALQVYNGHTTGIEYCVFDILSLDGNDLMQMPLVNRKELLKALTTGKKAFRYSESYEDGDLLYKQSLEQNLEGIVAKQKDSSYMPGVRGNAWLKIPTRKRQEFVIGAWAESTTSRSFKSLLFGAYENGNFIWIGRSGGGYKHQEMPAILSKLQEIEVDKSPFSNKILDIKGAVLHYVKPELVANFEFATWTKSGRIRKPATFLGFRYDKNPREVVREIPQDTAVMEQDAAREEDAALEEVSPAELNQQISKKGRSPLKAANIAEDSNWKMIQEEKINSEGEISVDGHQVHLTNIEKKLWKDVDKAALISYYNSISKYILPHLKDRPLSLHLKNLSANAPGFYIKDMEGMQPEYASIFPTLRKHKKKGKRAIIDYVVCNNLATLIYLINLGCIDINPWNSRTTDPLHPDFIAIDLDPSDNDFSKAIRTALAAKEYFAQLKLKAFVKTSGKSGIHMLIPCKGFTYPQARTLAEHICKKIHLRVLEITTIEVSVDHRGDKLFVDFSQNDEADTLACVYSVRPSKQPTVSTPLDWNEVTLQLTPDQFTIFNIQERIEQKGELFAGIQDPKVISSNTKILKTIL